MLREMVREDPWFVFCAVITVASIGAVLLAPEPFWAPITIVDVVLVVYAGWRRVHFQRPRS